MTKKFSIVRLTLTPIVSCPQIIKAKHKWTLENLYLDMDGGCAQVSQRGTPQAHNPYRSHPGAHFAEVLIYLSITGILATFNISKEVREDGLEITPELKFTTGITRYGLDLPTLFDVR